MPLDVPALSVNFIQDAAIRVRHNNHWKTNEGEETNAVDDDDLFLVFWREFFHNAFVHIVPLELDEHYEQGNGPDDCNEIKDAFLGHPTHIAQGINYADVPIRCHG